MVKHIVMFKLKEKTPENISLLENKIKSMEKTIDFVEEITTGVNFTKGERAMDLVLIVDLKDKDQLEAYRVHPEHQPVYEMVKLMCSESKVIDYEF
ncbi:MAG: Dabb family protein [Deltaproteobacteria bacterium]|nr:Dabb family protein [Deltaproteobacteria bacterium]